MPTFRRSLAVLLALALGTAAAAPTASAQPIRGVGEIHFNVGIPTGEFDTNIDGLGWGANGFIGAEFQTIPLTVGFDLGVLVYGRSTRTVPFSQTVGPAVQVDVVTTNSILQPHAVARLQPQAGPIRPYVEGLLGFKYLFTETRVRDDDFNDDRDIASTTNFDDFALSYGAGGGLQVVVYSGGGVRSVAISAGARYLFGGEAEYLAEGALVDDNQNGQLDPDELDIRRSNTNLIVPHLGAAIRF